MAMGYRIIGLLRLMTLEIRKEALLADAQKQATTQGPHSSTDNV